MLESARWKKCAVLLTDAGWERQVEAGAVTSFRASELEQRQTGCTVAVIFAGRAWTGTGVSLIDPE